MSSEVIIAKMRSAIVLCSKDYAIYRDCNSGRRSVNHRFLSTLTAEAYGVSASDCVCPSPPEASRPPTLFIHLHEWSIATPKIDCGLEAASARGRAQPTLSVPISTGLDPLLHMFRPMSDCEPSKHRSRIRPSDSVSSQPLGISLESRRLSFTRTDHPNRQDTVLPQIIPIVWDSFSPHYGVVPA